MIFKGVAQGLTEASSVGHCLTLASECDRLLLRDIICEHVEAEAAAKAHDRVPLYQYKKLAKSYKEALSKLIALAAEQRTRAQRSDADGANAQELRLALNAAAQDVLTLENNNSKAASVQDKQAASIANNIIQDDRIDEDEHEGKDAGKDKGEHEENEQELEDTAEVNYAKGPQGQAANIYTCDGLRILDLHGTLARTSKVTFRITSQAVVNVLYNMDDSQMLKAVSGAIKKKQTHIRSFLGPSYLSNLSMSDSGDISAVSNNAKQEDVLLLSQMSDWDKDIIDHDIGINFGTKWCYRLSIKGFPKANTLSGDLGSRRQKARLIHELVRINATTLTSLRIHHIKDVNYCPYPEEGNEILVVDFFDIHQAKAALLQGLYYYGNHYDCETLDKERFLGRCGYCQAYGHGVIACSGPPRCGKCSDRHRTKFCRSFLEKCVLCDGPHASNSSKCPAKQAERNSIRFTAVASRGYQATVQPETTVALPPISNSNDPAKQNAKLVHSDHSVMLEIRDMLDDIRNDTREIRVLMEELLAGFHKISGNRSQKRRALEPLMNGAWNDPGRSAKRVKQEEQQETETMDLYRNPSPYRIDRGY